ncbi:MAG: putative Ig domain-containing protein [Planctomycetota bacterium]
MLTFHRRAFSIALAGIGAILFSSATAFGQSQITVDPDNPRNKIVDIGVTPPATPVQPDLGPATEAGYAFQATGGGFVADFPADMTGNAFRVYRDGIQPITFAPLAMISRDAAGKVLYSEAASSSQPTMSNGRVTYAATWPAADDVFTPLPGQVKHDTIVSQKPQLASSAAWFGTTWKVTLPPGAQFDQVFVGTMTREGTLSVIGQDGTVRYRFNEVIVIDADGNEAKGQWRVEADGADWRVSIEVPAAFMRTAAYPVTIDPTIDILLVQDGNVICWGWCNPEGALQARYDKSQVTMGGTITAISVKAKAARPALDYPRLVVLMGESTKAANAWSSTYGSNYDAVTSVVVYDGAVNWAATAANTFFPNITLQTPFNYSGNNALTVEFRLYGLNSQGQVVDVDAGPNANNIRLYTVNQAIGAAGTLHVGYTNSIRLVIQDAVSISTPAAGALADGYVGTAWAGADVDAVGGPTPYVFDISAGSLPPGLSIASGTGIISGTPSTAGNYSFTVRVTDNSANVDTRAYTINVYSALQITSPGAGALADGVQNVPYTPVSVVATGGKPTLVWSLSAGSLPAGLSLNTGTGSISGTPTGTGLSNFTVRVTDANAVFVQRAYSITVYDLPTITSPATGALTPEGYVGDPYSRTWTAAGGAPAYTWSVVSGSLPAGLSLNTGTGQISGNPTTAGNSSFSIRVTDTNNDTDTEAYTLQILNLPSITSPSPGALPAATRNAPNYSQSFTGTNGKAPLAWSATGLPAGMSINSSTGALTGTPTASGNFNVAVTLTDANGKTDVENYTLTVNAALSIVSSSLPDATEETAYSATPTISGGTSPITWSMVINPALPELTMDPSTGEITGTPPAASSNNYTVTVTVTDTWGGTANKNLTFFVTLPTGGVAANCGCNSRATARDSAFTGWLLLLLPLLLLVARRRAA